MRSAENIAKIVKTLDLGIDTNTQADQAVLSELLDSQKQSMKKQSAFVLPTIRRLIMKSPITKLAAVAVIIIAVAISLNQFGRPTTSVAWGDVVKKIEASRGLIYRERTLPSDEGGCIMFYVSSTRSRMDTYKAGKITRTLYCDYDARNILCVDHNDKISANIPMEERDTQDHQREINLKDWVREVLSREHKKLGQKIIDGIMCEGIETIYPIFGDLDFSVKNRVTRVWVSVETKYPVLCEGGRIGEDGKLQIKAVLDQFQWDVELDTSEFEPNIPPDYEQM